MEHSFGTFVFSSSHENENTRSIVIPCIRNCERGANHSIKSVRDFRTFKSPGIFHRTFQDFSRTFWDFFVDGMHLQMSYYGTCSVEYI